MQVHQFGRSRAVLTALAIVLTTLFSVTSRAQQTLDPEDSYAKRVPGIVYVQYREGYGPQIVRKASPGGRGDPVGTRR